MAHEEARGDGITRTHRDRDTGVGGIHRQYHLISTVEQLSKVKDSLQFLHQHF